MTTPDELKAHRWLCHALSPYHSDDLLEPPEPALWPEIIKLSDAWLVSPRLKDRIQECPFVPEDAMSVLEIVSDFADERARIMRQELINVISTLNQAGLQPVVFKGAEWLLGYYSPSSKRLISDLDIWFPTDDHQTECLAVLQNIGYEPMMPWVEFNKSINHHFPPLHKEGAIARLEVHHSLIRPSLAHMMDLAGAEQRLLPTKLDDLSFFRLAPQDGVTVAYLQSTHMAAPGFATRKVSVSKWLDFLDRFREHGTESIPHVKEIGLTVDDSETDRQFLTVLMDYFGLPYSGQRDTNYIETWVQRESAGKIFLQGLSASATWQNLVSRKKWYSFFRGLGRRVKNTLFESKL